MTLDEIAYNILHLLRGGRSSNDELISIEQIKFNIKHYRAMFIRRYYVRNGYVSIRLEKVSGCIDLERVGASNCCNLPKDCPAYRTKRSLHKTVTFNLCDAFIIKGKPNETCTIPKI